MSIYENMLGLAPPSGQSIIGSLLPAGKINILSLKYLNVSEVKWGGAAS